MKKVLLPVVCISLIVASCNNNASEDAAKKAKADSIAKADSANAHGKLVVALVKDTIHGENVTDSKGKRQGHWVITNKTEHLKDYDSTAKVSEGYYSDNMKEGEWIEYNPNGSVKSKTIFKDDKPIQ
jgi:hypothetical protein